MYSPTTRLLAVLDLLRTHDSLTGAELAAHLEIGVRSVRRYVTMLQDLGLPIESVRGPQGGYRLAAEFRARTDYGRRPIWFSPDEALALALAAVYARQSAPAELAPAAEQALAKLEQLVPPALREQMRSLDEALVLHESEATRQPPISSAIVGMLSAAIRQRRPVLLHYRTHDGRESRRQVDPYGLVRTEGLWYLAGYCHQRKALRTFRLDRVLAAEPGEGTFTAPEKRDYLQLVEASIARTPQRWQAEVVLATTLEAAQQALPASLAVLEPSAEGVVMTCHVDDLDRLAHWLAGLPWRCRVRRPRALQTALLSLARKAERMAGE